MIQRIQTFFLSLTTAFNFIVYFTPIYTRAIEDPQQWIGLLMAVSLLAAIGICIATIVLYSDRKKQLKLLKYGIWMQFIALGAAAGVLLSLDGFGSFMFDELLSGMLIFLGLIGMFLAGKHIKKDEELVRSVDRIR